jgi:hypothetical protein
MHGSRRLIALTLAAALVAGNVLLHKSISDVCDALAARFGFRSYDRVALIVILVVCLLALVPFLLRSRWWPVRPRAAAAVVLLALLSVGAQRWLTFANIELIHYPQYAVVTASLLWGGVSPQWAWGLSTLGGVADEVYQYVVIYIDHANRYLDFNDMLFNAMGAAWPALLVAVRPSFIRDNETSPSLAGWWRTAAARRGGLAVLAGIAISYWLGPPRSVPPVPSPAGGLYHRLSAFEAAVIVALLWRVVAFVTARQGEDR